MQCKDSIPKQKNMPCKKTHPHHQTPPNPKTKESLMQGIICIPIPNVKTPSPMLTHGHVKLLTRHTFPVPNISPLTLFGTLALAQHWSATRLISSTSSSFSLSCLLASLLFLNLTPFSSALFEVPKGMLGYVIFRFWLGWEETGDETRLSRFTHSAISAWMPAESCVARESRYGHMSASSLQKGSASSALRSAGRICGRGGSARLGWGACSLDGDATGAVERRDAAMVRRMCDSVERVAETTHARSLLVLSSSKFHVARKRMGVVDVPGHPLPLHHSSSSVRKHCRHRNAPRASPANASSRSSLRWVHSAASARAEARRNSVTTGMMSACRMSRWRSHVSLAWASHWLWWVQKLLAG